MDEIIRKIRKKRRFNSTVHNIAIRLWGGDISENTVIINHIKNNNKKVDELDYTELLTEIEFILNITLDDSIVFSKIYEFGDLYDYVNKLTSMKNRS